MKYHFFLLEKGLKQAERITEALYKGDLMSLSTLNCAEIQAILKGATVVDVLAEPDITILQLAMKAKCFHNQSIKFRMLTLFSRLRIIFILFLWYKL